MLGLEIYNYEIYMKLLFRNWKNKNCEKK
jgi:hypothetical protein